MDEFDVDPQDFHPEVEVDPADFKPEAPATPAFDPYADFEAEQRERASAFEVRDPGFRTFTSDGRPRILSTPSDDRRRQLEARKDARLKAVLERSFGDDIERRAGIAELARWSGVDVSVVEARYDEFRNARVIGETDPAKLRKDQPELTKWIDERPGFVGMALRDPQVPEVIKELRKLKAQYWDPNQAASEALPDEFFALDGRDLTEEEAAKFKETHAQAMAAGAQKARQVDQPVLSLPAAAPQYFDEEGRPLPADAVGIVPAFHKDGSRVGLGEQLLGPDYARNARLVDRSVLGAELMDAELRGEDTWELEKRIIDLDRELVPRASSGSWFQSTLSEVLPSQAGSIKGGGIGAAIGAPVGAIAGGLIGRSPAAAVKGGGWGISILGGTGVFTATFDMERGGAYLEMRNMRTDDGRPVDRETAAGFALMYGAAAAGIELVSFGVQSAPIRKALTGASRREALAELMKDHTLLEVAKYAGKQWLKGSSSEAGEEFVQTILEDSFKWGARSYEAGEAQSADPFESVMSGLQTIPSALVGGGVFAAPGAATAFATKAHAGAAAARLDNAYRAADQVEQLQALKDSPTLKGHPDELAQVVADATKSGQQPYSIDAAELARLYQDENLEPAQRAVIEGMQAQVKEALATGGRVNVPGPEYLAQFVATGLGKRLAEHTTIGAATPTLAELEQDKEEIQKLAQAVVEEHGEQAKGDAAVKRFGELLQEHLVATGLVKPGEAPTLSAPMRAAVGALADRMDLAPDQVLEMFRLEVTRGDGAAAIPAGAMAQGDAFRTGASTHLEAEFKSLDDAGRRRLYYEDPTTGLLHERAIRDLPADPVRPNFGVITFAFKKSINDTLGHEQLNAVFRDIGRVLNSLAPRAGKVGGDFWVPAVKDQAELDTLVAKVREVVKKDLPEALQDLPIIGSVFERKEGEAWQTTKHRADDAIGGRATQLRGQRLYPEREAGLSRAEGVTFKGERVAPQPVPAELLQRLAGLSDFDVAMDAYTERETGLLNKAGWDAIRRRNPRPVVVSMDVRSVATMDKRFGHETTDTIVRTIAQHLADNGGHRFDLAHVSGDEFMAQGDDLTEIEAFFKRMKEELSAVELVFQGKAGRLNIQRGLHFSYGIAEGPDAEHRADAVELPAAKAADPRDKAWYASRATVIVAGAARGYLAANPPGRTGALRPRSPDQPGGVQDQVLGGLRGAPGRPGREGPGRLEQGDEGVGGPRGFTDFDRQGITRIFRVALNPNADLSTFLHESGHVLLELFGDLAERPDAPAQVKEDFGKLLGWFGVDARKGIQKEHHEKFARGLEAYLLEGKAPARDLRVAFRRIKRWLLRIYASVASLKVELNDEVRGVFDRLLATDREIIAAKRRMGLKQLYRSPVEMAAALGRAVTPEAWQAYLAEEEEAASFASRLAEISALKERLREKETWWKAEEASLREQAEQEYETSPARVAQRLVRGDDPLIGEPIMFDRAVVEAAVGAEASKKFRLRKEGGIHPDVVAPLAGFPDGALMLKAVLALPEKAAWAREQAASRMRERYPDLLSERDRLRELVEKGLHGDFTEKWLLREWDALTRGKGNQQLAGIREAARQLVENKTVGELRPKNILRDERRAADKKFRAQAKGNQALAFVHARQQLLNFYMHRAATDLRDRLDGADKYLAGRLSDSIRSELGKASQDLLVITDALLAVTGFGPPLGPDVDPLVALARADEAAKADANPLAFDVDAVRSLFARPRAWKELRTGEALNVRDAVQNIRALAKAMNEITVAGEKAKIEDIVGRIAQEAQVLPDLGKAPAAREQVSTLRKVGDKAIGMYGELLEPEQIFSSLGATASSLFKGYLDARKRKQELAAQVLDPVVVEWQAAMKDALKDRWDVIPELDQELPIPEDVNLGGPRDRMWLLMVALNMGNASNRERLVGGFGWEEQQVLDVLNRRLTKEEWQWVQGIWDVMDKQLWHHVAEKEQRKTGLVPEKIKATPIVTPHGAFRGGYFPAKYDPRASAGDVGERQEMAGIANLYGPGYVRASTLKNHTKKRAEHYENVVNLDWSVVPGHLAQVIHDVAFDEYVRDTARILFHPKVQETLYRRLGEKRVNGPRDWLKFVANEQAATATAMRGQLMQFLGALKSRLVVGAIGWSIPLAIADVTNALGAMARGREFGGTSVKYAIPAYLAALPLSPTYGPMRRMALGKSLELQRRLRSFSDQRRADFIKNVGKRRGGVTRVVEAIGNTAFFMLEQTDKMASTQIWLARYWQERSDGKTEAEAVELADTAVRANLPSPERAELPAFVRDPGGAGALMVFYGFFGKQLNVHAAMGRVSARKLVAASRSGRGADYAGAALKAAELAGRTLAMFFFLDVVGELLAGRGPEEDESAEEWATRKLLAAPFNRIPIVGGIAEPIIGKVMGRNVTASYRVAPALALIQNVVKGIGRLADGEGDAGERALAAVDLALTALKLPTSQVRRTFGYLEQVFSGEAESNPASGLIYGERERQPLNPITAIAGE